jgi:hypothetical protein
MPNYKFPTIFISVHKFTFVYFLIPKLEKRERNSSKNNEGESYWFLLFQQKKITKTGDKGFRSTRGVWR